MTPQGRVLVVDDNVTNRSLLRERLIRQGLHVEEAHDGHDALRKLGEGSFDLVLLDVMMPGLDGFETLRCIKTNPALCEIPVLMISASGEVDTVVRCLHLGAEDYLPKPFEPAVLRARVGTCLERKRLRDRERVHLEALRTERDRTKRLLLNVLPRSIADRLMGSETTIAESYPEATILFADIVAFTEFATRLPAREVVGILNGIFSGFDALLDRHGLEKIKTIGDAYLVAGGVPTPRPDHAFAVAAMSLDMLESLREFNLRNGTSFTMRIGINTGPVVAGVIGTHKFIFDLWGDAVNVASRMESHGKAGRIQLTETSWRILRGHYRFEERGLIPIKGKGRMRTYFMMGRQAA